MTMAHSTGGKSAKKPRKPRPDFPLFVHATGRWAKKVRGRFCYFGKVADDPKGEAALVLWLDQRDELLAGRTPRANRDGLTVHDLANRFLAAKEGQREAGDISPTTFSDYYATCGIVLKAFGKRRLVDDLATDEFEALRRALAKRYGPHALSRHVQQVRTLFKFAYDSGLVDTPIRFGPTFKRPAKRLMRAHKQKSVPRMFEAREIRRLLKASAQPLRAMILLGINCGFGNADCGKLPKSAIDLKTGWVNFPRPKTAIERRCWLWPETIEALREASKTRPKPKRQEDDVLFFLTKYGEPWAKDTSDNPVTKEARKLLDKTQLHRRGLGFYTLRHVFETIAGEGRDQVAVDVIMGHADDSMASHYRERISDQRLEDVAVFVRNWLFRRTSHDLWFSSRVKGGE